MKAKSIFGTESVLSLLAGMENHERNFANLVQAGFSGPQLKQATQTLIRLAETRIQRFAARRMADGHYDDEDLEIILCGFYDCDEWKLETSPLFFSKQDYRRLAHSLLAPIEAEIQILDQRMGEERWGPIFLRNPYSLGASKAKAIIWEVACNAEHEWSGQDSYRAHRAAQMIAYLRARIDPDRISQDHFFFEWEKSFVLSLAGAMERFEQAMERAVRYWQDQRNREKRRAKFHPGTYLSPAEIPVIEVKEALAHLGLDPLSANLNDLQRKYRTLSKSAHPDQGGSEDSFRYLASCRDIAESWIRRHQDV